MKPSVYVDHQLPSLSAHDCLHAEQPFNTQAKLGRQSSPSHTALASMEEHGLGNMYMPIKHTHQWQIVEPFIFIFQSLLFRRFGASQLRDEKQVIDPTNKK